MQCLEVSGAVRHTYIYIYIYIYDVSRLRVKSGAGDQNTYMKGTELNAKYFCLNLFNYQLDAQFLYPVIYVLH
jgi:hypothetical protein